MFITIETTIEQMKVTNEVRPNTILEAMYEMNNFVSGHREAKGPLKNLRDLKTKMMATNAALQSHTHRFLIEGEGCRGEGNNQEKFLGLVRRRKVHRFSTPATYLIGHCKARVEIPVKEPFHSVDHRLDPWGKVEQGGGEERSGEENIAPS